MSTTSAGFAFDNTYARDLEGLYSPATGPGFPAPELIKRNDELARELGLDLDVLTGDFAAAVFTGNHLPEGATPLAQVYAGHQFGGFSPQLGDGRALLIGEVIDTQGRRRDLHLKGSGPTPYSRGGDGRATLGPVLREYIIGEAMHALGIPTTRVLGAATTGERVYRDRELAGAVLARVASSHIRVGTFQYFASRQDQAALRKLADYTIARHYPEHCDEENPYEALLRSVIAVQAELVARWMSVGFIHGVMNTDNVTISGETIDYGPCAFMDGFDPATVFSSIDKRGRYAYGNQPGITQWNMTRFAEALLTLLADDEKEAIGIAERALRNFAPLYESAWLAQMRAKLGLAEPKSDDRSLAEGFLGLMEPTAVDFTGAFRALANAARGDRGDLESLFPDTDALTRWVERWEARLAAEGRASDLAADAMDTVNPVYIPRNHKVEEALAAAVDDGDLQPFETLVAVLADPFSEREGLAAYAAPAPDDFGNYVTFCGT